MVETKGTGEAPAEYATTQRAVLKAALNDIAAEVGDKLRRANLNFPIYLTVPNSGDALATVACPLDPADEDWSQASQIVCRVIGEQLGGLKLRGRELTCAIANAAMAAADVTVESVQSDGIAGHAVADV